MTRRVLITVLVVCTLAVGLFFVPMALIVRNQNRHTDLLELQRLSAVAMRSVPASAAGAAGWRPPDADSDHRYALYNTAGQRVAGEGPDTADFAVLDALQGAVAGGTTPDEIVAATPLGTGPGPTGALRVAEVVTESNARTAATIGWMSALALGAVAFAAGAGWWLLRRLLGPVKSLQAAAERLGQGDFTVEVPATGLPEFDEVGRALSLSGARIGRLVDRERAFSADASHELRTPVAAVIVALEAELLAPRPDRHIVLHESLAALARLQATIDDLLRLARDTPGDRAPVDLCMLLDDVRTDWLARYRSAERPLQTRCRQLPAVNASSAAVRHILDVLVDNALHRAMSVAKGVVDQDMAR